MKIALGLSPHSGWAVLVALAARGGEALLVERRRIELVEPGESWAKAPYHAAEELELADAERLVERAVASAHRIAERELRAAAKRARDAGHEIAACAVLMSKPLPAWSVAEIRAVHFRMHMAEGVLFREALARAAERCGLRLVGLEEKELPEPPRTLLALAKAAGAPWGKDQKQAALAAWIALEGGSPKGRVRRT
jgi:hypothetical protein